MLDLTQAQRQHLFGTTCPCTQWDRCKMLSIPHHHRRATVAPWLEQPIIYRDQLPEVMQMILRDYEMQGYVYVTEPGGRRCNVNSQGVKI